MAAIGSLKSLLCRRQPQVTSSLRSLANFRIPSCQSVKLARFKHLVWLETCFDLCRLHAFYPSESSSTTSASSTASIVLLAEGEAATSETLQSTVLSVLGSKGGKLL